MQYQPEVAAEEVTIFRVARLQTNRLLKARQLRLLGKLSGQECRAGEDHIKASHQHRGQQHGNLLNGAIERYSHTREQRQSSNSCAGYALVEVALSLGSSVLTNSSLSGSSA